MNNYTRSVLTNLFTELDEEDFDEYQEQSDQQEWLEDDNRARAEDMRRA